MNASLEYGKMGSSLLKENYLKLTFSASINEFWFVKPKLNSFAVWSLKHENFKTNNYQSDSRLLGGCCVFGAVSWKGRTEKIAAVSDRKIAWTSCHQSNYGHFRPGITRYRIYTDQWDIFWQGKGKLLGIPKKDCIWAIWWKSGHRCEFHQSIWPVLWRSKIMEFRGKGKPSTCWAKCLKVNGYSGISHRNLICIPIHWWKSPAHPRGIRLWLPVEPVHDQIQFLAALKGIIVLPPEEGEIPWLQYQEMLPDHKRDYSTI